jgi:hypothetical protein
MNFFRNLKKGIWNLISWFSIIWHDRDWDYYFLYELLKFKLERMENYLRKHGHSLDSEKDADSIQECVVILKRLINEDYVAEDWNRIHARWGEFECIPMEDGHSRLECTHVKTDEDREKYSSDIKNCCEKEESLVQGDLNALFENMKLNIRRWWD